MLAEQPFYPGRAIFLNAPYVLNSTAHWKPLMNGYSGYTPNGYEEYADTFSSFPEERSFTAMKARGVTHVMVHPDRLVGADPPKIVEEISHRPDMGLVVSRGNDSLSARGRSDAPHTIELISVTAFARPER